MDANETYEEKAWWKLHKNAASNIEPVLEAAPHKRLITKTIQVRRTRQARYCWWTRDEPISDVLLWTPSHRRARAGRPAWTCIQQLCVDTGCRPEDLPEAMYNRERWRERVRGISADDATWWWWGLKQALFIDQYLSVRAGCNTKSIF